MIRLQHILLSAALLLGATACHQRELCHDHTHTATVEVRFDWSEAPEADPGTMVVRAFPTDGSEGVRHELVKRGGSFDARLRLAPGEYELLAFNGDTDTNIEQGDRFDEFRITSISRELLGPLNRSESAPRPGDTETQPVRAPASTLYACVHGERLRIDPGDAARGTTHTVLFTPRRVSAVWNVRIEEVRNLRADTEASAVVTGVAEAWHPASQRPAGAQVTVPFALEHCGESCLRGTAILFGDAAPHDVKHLLRVYTTYRYYYDFDITEQVHAAPDPLQADIVVRGLTLPVEGSGMAPGVSEWEDAENQEILM